MAMPIWLFRAKQVAAKIVPGTLLLLRSNGRDSPPNLFTPGSPRHGFGRDAKAALGQMLRPVLHTSKQYPSKDETRSGGFTGVTRHTPRAAPHMRATAGWPLLDARVGGTDCDALLCVAS